MKLTDVVLVSCQKKGGSIVHTISVRPNVITSMTVHLRKFTTVDGADVEEILPTLPYWIQTVLRQFVP